MEKKHALKGMEIFSLQSLRFQTRGNNINHEFMIGKNNETVPTCFAPNTLLINVVLECMSAELHNMFYVFIPLPFILFSPPFQFAFGFKSTYTRYSIQYWKESCAQNLVHRILCIQSTMINISQLWLKLCHILTYFPVTHYATNRSINVCYKPY